MNKKDFSKRILISITGNQNIHWQDKLKEIERYKIREVALFLECFEKDQRQEIYKALLNSKIKKIPLVHIRHDMVKEELKFLIKHFDSKYLTIHEDSFDILKKWKGYYKKLFLEMNYDNFVAKNVQIKKIGGFCVDLSHFKAAQEQWSKEFEYTIEKRKKEILFACNHLNGYSYEKNIDLHVIKTLKDFDYLKTLPGFLFGDKIGIECNNSITEQLKFKKYLVNLLNNK